MINDLSIGDILVLQFFLVKRLKSC